LEIVHENVLQVIWSSIYYGQLTNGKRLPKCSMITANYRSICQLAKRKQGPKQQSKPWLEHTDGQQTVGQLDNVYQRRHSMRTTNAIKINICNINSRSATPIDTPKESLSW